MGTQFITTASIINLSLITLVILCKTEWSVAYFDRMLFILIETNFNVELTVKTKLIKLLILIKYILKVSIDRKTIYEQVVPWQRNNNKNAYFCKWSPVSSHPIWSITGLTLLRIYFYKNHLKNKTPYTVTVSLQTSRDMLKSEYDTEVQITPPRRKANKK